VSQYVWHAKLDKKCWYAKRSTRVDGKHVLVAMHAFLLQPPPGFIADHVNNDGLDNRRKNLRLATITENNRNSRSRPGVSRFKGVSWHAKGKCWYVRIKCNERTHSVGCFDTEVAAALAYDDAAKRLHGEFAWLNSNHSPELTRLVLPSEGRRGR
jgi:hypothetical protein